MKRSDINSRIESSLRLVESLGFRLPPFSRWTPEQWAAKGHEVDEIRRCRLGWDVTDFDTGEFDRCGLVLFTLRNGHPSSPQSIKTYCEKVMIVGDGAITPMHFHFTKTEDIINRGGDLLVCELHNASDDEQLASSAVDVSIDGVAQRLPAGSQIELHPGESITMTPRLYHSFWAKRGNGVVLAGEVSSINDDAKDNRFLAPIARFPTIEEDERPRFLLCNEYPVSEGA